MAFTTLGWLVLHAYIASCGLAGVAWEAADGLYACCRWRHERLWWTSCRQFLHCMALFQWVRPCCTLLHCIPTWALSQLDPDPSINAALP